MNRTSYDLKYNIFQWEETIYSTTFFFVALEETEGRKSSKISNQTEMITFRE